MDVVEVLSSIPAGSLRSYTWVARQLGFEGNAARSAGQRIAKETLHRWSTPQKEQQAAPEALAEFPWWRVVGVHGDVRTALEDVLWHARQVERLESEGHVLEPSLEIQDALRVRRLPDDFQ